MTGLALRAACHWARLDVLDEVRRQVNGTDWYEAPAPPDGSPSQGDCMLETLDQRRRLRCR